MDGTGKNDQSDVVACMRLFARRCRLFARRGWCPHTEDELQRVDSQMLELIAGNPGHYRGIVEEVYAVSNAVRPWWRNRQLSRTEADMVIRWLAEMEGELRLERQAITGPAPAWLPLLDRVIARISSRDDDVLLSIWHGDCAFRGRWEEYTRGLCQSGHCIDWLLETP